MEPLEWPPVGPREVCALSIIADFDDLAPAELLLVLSLSRRTGRVTAARDDQKIVLTLRNGSIVYAASPAIRERLGDILVKRILEAIGRG